MESVSGCFLLKVAELKQPVDWFQMGFQLVVAVDPLRDVDRSVRRAAEEREWLKVAGGSKAHLLEAKSLRDFPSPGWNSMRDFF